MTMNRSQYAKPARGVRRGGASEGSGALTKGPSRRRSQHPDVLGNIRRNTFVRLQSCEQRQRCRHRALITTGPEGQEQSIL